MDMKRLSLKEFISKLSARLEKFTHEELKEILLEHAQNLRPEERAPFLAAFALPNKRKSDRAVPGDADLLLKEIEAFGKRVENYEYPERSCPRLLTSVTIWTY